MRRRGQIAEEILRRDGLIDGYEELVAVGVPASLLMPGDYEVVLEGRMNDWNPDRFAPVSRTAFSVVPSE
jgi:hypothetical protein